MTINEVVSYMIAGSILLLAFLLIINPLNTNKKGNFYFGIFLLVWSTFWLDESISLQDFKYRFYFIIFKGLIQFSTPLFFYLGIKFYTNPYFNIRKKLPTLLIFPSIYCLILIYINNSTNVVLQKIPTIIIIINALFYTILAFFSLNKHQKNIESIISNKEPIDLNWIKNIIYAMIVSTIISMLYNSFIDTNSLNLYMNLYYLAIIYFIAYYSIKQGEIYPQQININEIIYLNNIQEEQQTKKELLTQTELETLKEQLLTLMDSEKPYLDSELNLVKLAKKLSLTTHQLSYVINSGFNENFFQFINKYKVEKAKELLKNIKYDNYTIIAIGFESGFNSKTAFNTTFKKITSYTPTEYRNNRSNL